MILVTGIDNQFLLLYHHKKVKETSFRCPFYVIPVCKNPKLKVTQNLYASLKIDEYKTNGFTILNQFLIT